MLNSVVNFRRVTIAGGLRHGSLFRSGSCGEIADADAETVASAWGIRTIIDLRSAAERARSGGLRALSARGVRCLHRPLDLDPRFRALAEVDAADYLRLYFHLVDANRAAIADIVALAAAAGGSPLLIACTMGKDRTGVVCALLLGLLGCSDEEIAADYARSGPPLRASLERFRDRWERRGVPPETYARRLACDPAVMIAWCRRIRGHGLRWEDVASRLGIDDATLEALRSSLRARVPVLGSAPPYALEEEHP